MKIESGKNGSKKIKRPIIVKHKLFYENILKMEFLLEI
jgi:hypothetical protein